MLARIPVNNISAHINVAGRQLSCKVLGLIHVLATQEKALKAEQLILAWLQHPPAYQQIQKRQELACRGACVLSAHVAAHSKLPAVQLLLPTTTTLSTAVATSAHACVNDHLRLVRVKLLLQLLALRQQRCIH
jgi:hypothetical protein